jgi:hypothetical protein
MLLIAAGVVTMSAPRLCGQDSPPKEAEALRKQVKDLQKQVEALKRENEALKRRADEQAAETLRKREAAWLRNMLQDERRLEVLPVALLQSIVEAEASALRVWRKFSSTSARLRCGKASLPVHLLVEALAFSQKLLHDKQR